MYQRRKEVCCMTIYSTYKVKIKHYNHIFKDTISVYRAAVDYLIHVCIEDWDNITSYEKPFEKQRFVETLIHKTKDNPNVAYDFDVHFYKFHVIYAEELSVKQLVRYHLIKATLQAGKLIRRGKLLRFQKLDISTHLCIVQICTSKQGLTKRKSRFISATPGIGSPLTLESQI